MATCVAAAVKAAEIIRAGAERRSELDWRSKSRSDFVSEVDEAAERAIAALIGERHPGAILVGEELSSDSLDVALGSRLAFVADPLDGTTNFLHGFPWYAVSIAALVDGVTRAGLILNAATGEMFAATLGGGARRNGQKIEVSGIDDPSRALIGTGMPFKHPDMVEPYMRVLPDIMVNTAGIRRPGSAALDLADVACGRFDGFWEMRLAPWDVAAGILLVREAGGIVTDLAGRPASVAHGPIVAGNPAMHTWLLERVGETRQRE